MLEKNTGHLHPISLIINKVSKIFQDIGFSVVDGPELETEWYNFDALNVAPDHPSRDMQDTFWVDATAGSIDGLLEVKSGKKIENTKSGRKVLRTHTSSMQIHAMEEWVKKNKENFDKGLDVSPLAIICPGKVFRNEATDATHEAQFYQLECLYIDKKERVSIGNLKWTIEKYLSELFQKEINVRFRSSYFPFVEPALEVDMSCFRCGGSGCSTCKQSGYIEILGSGMVHPKVLSMSGIDPEKYAGFAFGGGIDRIAMMLYGIEDVRNLYNADMRLTNQF